MSNKIKKHQKILNQLNINHNCVLIVASLRIYKSLEECAERRAKMNIVGALDSSGEREGGGAGGRETIFKHTFVCPPENDDHCVKASPPRTSHTLSPWSWT